MPILKKKGSKRRKRKKDNSNLQGKVYMPQKNGSSTPIQKRRRFSIFKKSSRNITKRKLSRRKKVLSKVSRLFFYILLPLIFIALLYISTLFIINMRNGTNTAEDKEKEYVIGIEEIPTYPESQFIFQNNIDEPAVANFISSGNSAYRLPLNTTVTQAYEYYNDLLPELGWEHVLSVEVGSEEMKQGEYWVKDNTGLRIYSKFNDLWYELITVEQANNGLRERVEREIERDLLLASDELQELLPDFPWVIEIPKEYIISYRTSNYDDLRTVEFRKIGTDETVTVTPVGSIGGPLDNHLRVYLDYLNEQEEEKGEWAITNTILAYTVYGTALQGTISFNGQPQQVAVVSNTYNNVVYVIHSNRPESSFFEFIFSNLLPANMNRD
jgi:hypothetical protein